MAGELREGIELYWLPLGAGGFFVRWNGRLNEALTAWRQQRPAQPLFHSALIVSLGAHSHVIEMAPVWAVREPGRGVVVEGPVATSVLGRLRGFRYEVRCWTRCSC